MEILVGTSGYSYKEWKGSFYPEDLPASKMLSYYAERFSTVEINNTFYRMPEAKTLEGWKKQVPAHFRFILKSPQRITHQKKLVDAGDDARHLFTTAEVLGDQLGPVLFQLPPFSRKDAAKLKSFIAELPAGKQVAFEFRHASWFDDEIYSVLRERNIALCLSDTDESTEEDRRIVPTADFGYTRLRRTMYAEGEIAQWAEKIKSQPWKTAHVFFKHEDEGKGPKFANEFLAAL
jgi:uncharacterized protein YecE (DUF72 family)